MSYARRAPRGENELRGAAKHLLYEVEMLRTPVQYLAMTHRDVFLDNICLGAFADHARVLLHFLYPDDALNADDVVAADYFQSPDAWLSLRGPHLPEALRCVRSEKPAGVPLLQYSRLSLAPQAKAWDVGAIYSALNAVLKLFAEGAPELDPLIRHELAHPPAFETPKRQTSKPANARWAG